MPTMAAWMTYLPKGFQTKPIRSTDGIVMALAEGALTASVGDRSFDLSVSDVAVAPGWTWRSYTATEDSFLFCFSDRVAQEKLGLWREERGR
jgi:gentisate 1,2-dioxygenase